MTAFLSQVRRSPAVLCLALALLSAATVARAADVRPIGLIDMTRIMKEYGAAKDAIEQHKKFIDGLQKEDETKAKALQTAYEAFQSQRALLGEAAVQAKQQELQKMQDDYMAWGEQAKAKEQSDQETRFGPILDQVRTIAERLGKELGYALILDRSAVPVVYSDSSIDLTDKVLAALVSGK